MTDNDATVVEETNIVTADSTPTFYVVSKRKMAILFVATMGMYMVYWFYKNWDRYKDKTPYASKVGSTIWPVPRAVFSIFFVHSLFRKVKEHGASKAVVAKWRYTLGASLLVITMIAAEILDRAANKSLGSPYTDFLSLVMLVPLVLQFLKAQEMINISCDDPSGATNSKFSKANYAWIIGGALFWLLVVASFFIAGDATTPYSPEAAASGF
jgi:hypothetical protein